MKKLLSIFIVTVILVGFLYWFWISPPSGRTQTIFFPIHSGETWDRVAEHLQGQGMIRSPRVFLLFTRLRGVDTNLRAGRYQLQKGMTLTQILLAITDPKQTEVSVTIPEGYSTHEIDERLTGMGLIDEGDFRMAAFNSEGYLFPDTYFVFANNSVSQQLIKKMQANFISKITPELKTAVEKQNRSLQEVITMASIVEKEVRTEQDLPVVAGILWKRLDKGWPLQADATLLYGKDVPTISKSDLEGDNPYNTRNKKGLPPTPIDNPGMRAIQAAVYPKESPYWFYLTDKEGQVHYAVTNDEHNENRRLYLDK